jgi:psiF repeat
VHRIVNSFRVSDSRQCCRTRSIDDAPGRIAIENSERTYDFVYLAVCCLSASLAHAASPTTVGGPGDKALTPQQQQKMKACNAQAGDQKLEGSARKASMSDCLKASQPMGQQDKMKACNKDASANALKGDERKAFMSTCLAGEKKS